MLVEYVLVCVLYTVVVLDAVLNDKSGLIGDFGWDWHAVKPAR